MGVVIRRRRRPRSRAALRAAAMAVPLLLAAAALQAASSRDEGDEVWVHVDTKQATLEVYRGNRVVERIEAIAIGRAGASRDRRLGDRRTPLGEFRVRDVRQSPRWDLFFQIDYPNEERAARGLRSGEIDPATHARITQALRQGRMPPQDTPLGGFLGIHGLGRGDIRIHRAFHWTEGCIAVTNEEIAVLSRWIRENTRVVIE